MLHRADVHAVSLALALGYVIEHIGAARFQVGIHHRGGGDAVRVVIAVHSDFLHPVDGLRDACRRAIHVLQEERIGKRHTRTEEFLRVRRVVQPADIHQHREEGRYADRFGKGRCAPLIERANLPFPYIHIASSFSAQFS